jgi:hypothetical protein
MLKRETSIILLILIISTSVAYAQRPTPYQFTYQDREHSVKEDLNHLGSIYVLSWGLYYLSQPTTFREEGSFRKYKKNFGKVVFDKDEPYWNWVIHPFSGSQLYLYYRANGYERVKAATMAFLSSSLFEFAIENYTEPASIQDLYQTPILGSALGLILENFSMYLLNTGNPFLKFCGHVINPYTLFWFYDGKVRITPNLTSQSKGFVLRAEF